jgi:hypothetical protein
MRELMILNLSNGSQRHENSRTSRKSEIRSEIRRVFPARLKQDSSPMSICTRSAQGPNPTELAHETLSVSTVPAGVAGVAAVAGIGAQWWSTAVEVVI